MIEYLYNAIRAHAGNDIVLSAIITDDEGNNITEGITLAFHDKDRDTMIAKFDGTFSEETGEWTFAILKEYTEGLNGRYWYCIQKDGNALCFKEPIYLV